MRIENFIHFIHLLREKRNAYVDAMNENEIGTPYWNYCRGKRDILDDILVYIFENFE